MLKYSLVSKQKLADITRRMESAEAELRAVLEQVNAIKSGDLQSHNYTVDTELLKSLESMRQQMLKLQMEEQQRTWTNEGIAKFSDLIRVHQHDHKIFYDKLIGNLVNYLGANQGQIYVTRNEKSVYLEVVGCYAYGKKKFVTNKVECGEGLVGQCHLEQDVILLKEVPENYVRITSGLGEALPRCVILVPLLSENTTVGVIELASFRMFEEFEIQFIRKIAEGIASTVVNMGVSEKTNLLLRESQAQAEQLKTQEEEMRQNMEELTATQEEMKRVQMEVLAQTNIINSVAIVSRTDRQGNITYMNDEFCKWAKYSREELMGKNHRILKSRHQPDEIFKELWQTISSGRIWRGEIKNRAKDGTYYWVDAIIAPILDEDGKPKEYIAQRFVINDKKEREEQLMRNQKNLEESEEAITTILNNSPFGIIRMNAEGEFQFLNKQMENMLGATAGPAIRYQTVFKVLPLEKIKQGDKKRAKIFPAIGKPFMAEVIVTDLKGELLLFVRDVMNEIHKEQELVKSLEQAEVLKNELLQKENEYKKQLGLV